MLNHCRIIWWSHHSIVIFSTTTNPGVFYSLHELHYDNRPVRFVTTTLLSHLLLHLSLAQHLPCIASIRNQVTADIITLFLSNHSGASGQPSEEDPHKKGWFQYLEGDWQGDLQWGERLEISTFFLLSNTQSITDKCSWYKHLNIQLVCYRLL